MTDQPTTLAEIKRIPFLQKRLYKILDTLLDNPQNTVIWIGAGLSAKYGGLPTWRNFLMQVLEKNLNSADDLEVAKTLIRVEKFSLAAEFLHDMLGDQFRQILVNAFGAFSGTLPDQLAYLTVRDIITTNYDTLLETALPWYKAISPSDGLELLLSQDFKIVKIHGSVSVPSSCVASVSGYAGAYNSNLHWYLVNVFSQNTVLFLGSSMSPSEPYFRTLKFLKDNGRLGRQHYSLLAVQNSKFGKREGKRLHGLGIHVLPYIPDPSHSILDELFTEIDSLRGKPSAVDARMGLLRICLSSKRFLDAAAVLYHTCHAPVANIGLQRNIGDAVSLFFHESLGGDQFRGKKFFETVDQYFDLKQLWFRSAELVVLSKKTFQGLQYSLQLLEQASGRTDPLLRRKLEELRKRLPELASA